VKVVSVVGARPQFVKLAPIADAMTGRLDHDIVHTGQHYDEQMSDAFFTELGIPTPTLNLHIGSGTHAQQTSAMLVPLEEFFHEAQPDWVLIYGDTNSTLGAALVAAKLNLPIAHLEAGLRSGNRSMPEEVNRIVADHLSALNLAPSHSALENLTKEGLAEKSILVGDVMVDALNFARQKVEESPPPRVWQGDLDGDYLMATLHRQELTASRDKLGAVISALSSLHLPVFLAAHPRLIKTLENFDLMPLVGGSLQLIPPLGYLQLVDAVSRSRGVITDSGGLQKETYLLGVPCLTVRPETEWVETLIGGWNTLVWEDVSHIADFPPAKELADHHPEVFGDGKAAERVVELLLENSA
jgi:UDP-N-acetylglucosamine 2-epimerase (non-hydrolysing)